MPTVYKIHPAIGIARVGNSPDEFFIGPERLGEEPAPADGFKDAQCRIKRQGARFRIYAHHDDGSFDEITDAQAEIEWTVQLCNKKAANPGRGNTEPDAQLTIDPGARTINGPSQRALFDTGTIAFDDGPVTVVPLGEIRSDPASHLIVLGGFGTSASPPATALSGYFWATDDWYDDVSDGPVSARITLRGDGSTPAVAGAWVIVGPPKFAPHQQSVITLYDRLLAAMIEGGLLAEPTVTSYTQDVYPILQRARDTRWVEHTRAGHTWTDPVTSDALRAAIFDSLKVPGGGNGTLHMPPLNDSGTLDDRLTATQYAHMQRWRDNQYTNDWSGVPAAQVSITPGGLDRAALEACVGGAFFPGIEAGGLPNERPLLDVANYAEPLRLNHAVMRPGDVSYVMALPWQNDFFQCADRWWPVPRPNYVVRSGVLGTHWLDGLVTSGQEMVDRWHRLGFVVRQGDEHIEVARCDVPSIQLLTPVLDFRDVPQGPMGMVREVALAIAFEVISPADAVTLQYAAGGAPANPRLVAADTSVTVGPTAPSTVASARLWVIYRTGPVGDVMPPQTVTVAQSGGSRSWSITILGNTVARKTAATALVLDRSGSMAEDRGDGQSKHASLQSAAEIFVDVMLEGDGVGVVRFNQDAQVLQPVLALGNGGLSDLNRSQTKDVIRGSGLDPNGETSIGDGIFEARGMLAASATPFDVKSLVVLTDGMENQPRSIGDVASQIDETTYAVGLGRPQNISVPALQAISGNSGAYLLVTGAIGSDNRFLLQKYFLQILAGVSNAEIVLDPDGELVPGQVQRVPFSVTAGDAGIDVILLSPHVKLVDFRVQTPSGRLIEPWRASSEPGMRFVLSSGVSYYRLALPAELFAGRFDGSGTWAALLTIGRPRTEPSESHDGSDGSILRAARRPAQPVPSRVASSAQDRRASIVAADRTHAVAVAQTSTRSPLRYSLIVHAYSNLSLRAHIAQSSFEPGAELGLSASLSQSGIALGQRAQIWAEVTLPDARTTSVALVEYGAGEFSGRFVTTIAGVYRFRVRASGSTRRGEAFVRERTLTAAVWRGGDRGDGPGGGCGNADGSCICKLLGCLLQPGALLTPALERHLKELGVDLQKVRACLEHSGKGR